MKRRDLERHLRAHGARLLREGGNHSFWGFDAERSTAVPRHREIDYRLVPQDLRRPALADRPVWGSCGEVLHRKGPISAVLSGSAQSFPHGANPFYHWVCTYFRGSGWRESNPRDQLGRLELYH